MQAIESVWTKKLKTIRDGRGRFFKILSEATEALNLNEFELYIVTAGARQSRGGHYHLEANEWFVLLAGYCELKLLCTQANTAMTFNLSGDQPMVVYVPSGVTHEFRNMGESEFILLAFTDKRYDPNDTVPLEINK